MTEPAGKSLELFEPDKTDTPGIEAEWVIPVDRSQLMSCLSRGYLDARLDMPKFTIEQDGTVIPLFRRGLCPGELTAYFTAPDLVYFFSVNPESLGPVRVKIYNGKALTKTRRLPKKIAKSWQLILILDNLDLSDIESLVFRDETQLLKMTGRPFGNFRYDSLCHSHQSSLFEAPEKYLNRKSLFSPGDSVAEDPASTCLENFSSDRVCGFLACVSSDSINSIFAVEVLEQILVGSKPTSSAGAINSQLVGDCLNYLVEGIADVTQKQRSIYSKYGLDGLMCFTSMEFLSRQDENDGWTSSEMFEVVLDSTTKVDANAQDLENYQKWAEYCSGYLDSTKILHNLEDTGGSLVQRSLLLLLVRMKLSNILEVNDGKTKIGPNVRSLAAGLAGLVVGFEGLDTEHKYTDGQFYPWSLVNYSLRQRELGESKKIRKNLKIECLRKTEKSKNGILETLSARIQSEPWIALCSAKVEPPTGLTQLQSRISESGFKTELQNPNENLWVLFMPDLITSGFERVAIIPDPGNYKIVARTYASKRKPGVKLVDELQRLMQEKNGALAIWYAKEKTGWVINVASPFPMDEPEAAMLASKIQNFVDSIRGLEDIVA